MKIQYKPFITIPCLTQQIVSIAIFCILSAGCGGKKFIAHLDAPDQYEVAMQAYEKNDYGKAAEAFQRVVLEHPGSDLVDDAQFYLGECYFHDKDYTTAEIEYRYLIDTYPESSYIDDATYRLGLCSLRRAPAYFRDQTMIEEARDIFNEFLIRFPQSELKEEVEEAKHECQNRLARKELENGRFYLKLGYYQSAQIYFRYVLDTYPDSDVVSEAMLLLAESLYKQEHREEARELYAQLAENRKAGRFSMEARKRLNRMDEEH